MNVKQLRELLDRLPDDARVLQETGDHNLYEPSIEVSVVYDDEDYGLVESHVPHDPYNRSALIIR